MKIGILQCGHTAPNIIKHHGEYADMFERLLAAHGWAFETWRVVDEHFPDSHDAADGWLLTGSPLGVYDDAAFIPTLEVFIQDLAAREAPMVGICFGHQIIAQALGGKVVKHPGGWRLGPQDYQITGATSPVSLHAWHQDQVTHLPDGAEIIAEGPDCKIAGFAISGHVWTLQPHPEFDDGVIERLIATRRGAPGYETAPIPEAEAALGTPVDQSWAAQQIGRFFAEAEARRNG